MVRRLLLLVFPLGLSAGCSSAIVGKWEASSENGGAEGKFRFAKVEFTKDGKFTAEETQAEARHESAGTYQFTGFELKLKTEKGERKYGAVYNAFTNTLKVTHRESGKSVVMKRLKESATP